MSVERSKNKQLAINIIANITIYLLQFGVSFFLTPFIVKYLGVEAHGFIQLSSQIISYTTLTTVALNAMSSRFITIEYHRENWNQANKFFSSVFYGNLFLSLLSLFTCICLVFYLDVIVHIPQHLVTDVKCLFGLLSINSTLSIVCSVFNIATFVKNRLELRSIRTAIGSVITTSLILLLFSMFTPKLWFLGITSFVSTIYVIIVNIKYTRSLTPELRVDIRLFDWVSIKMLLSAGLWSLTIVLTGLLAHGFDLLLSNVFIGATAMGILSLSKSIPVILQSIATSLSTCFSPSWTQCYALGNRESLKNELLKSISIMGFVSCIPTALFFSFGKDFYALWLPGQDYSMIYTLSLVGMAGYVFAMPLDALWEIFNVENKIKMSSVAQIVSNLVVFAVIIVGVFIVHDNIWRLYIIAGARSLMLAVRALTFLSFKTAKIINISVFEIYKPLIKSVLALFIILIISLIVRNIFPISSWWQLFLAVFVSGVLSLITTIYIVLNNFQREYLIGVILSKLHIKK